LTGAVIGFQEFVNSWIVLAVCGNINFPRVDHCYTGAASCTLCRKMCILCELTGLLAHTEWQR